MKPVSSAQFRAIARLPIRPAITGGGLTKTFKSDLLALAAALSLAAILTAAVWLGIFNY